MRTPAIVFAVGIACSHPTTPSRHFGKLADGTAELFNTLCRDLGEHVISDDNLEWTRAQLKVRPDILANPNLTAIYCSNNRDADAIGSYLVADRVSHELLQFQVFAKKSRLPEIEHVFMPVLSFGQLAGLLVQELRLADPRKPGQPWSDGGTVINVGPLFDSDKMVVELMSVMPKEYYTQPK